MAYIEPKTSWTADSAPLPSDMNRIEGNIKQNREDVIAEASSRANADSDLQALISHESSARANADSDLQALISHESSARANADNSLASAVNTKQPLPHSNGDPGQYDFPVGTTIVASTESNVGRNTIMTVVIVPVNPYYYRTYGDGTALSGTWVSRGQIETGKSLFQRVG